MKRILWETSRTGCRRGDPARHGAHRGAAASSAWPRRSSASPSPVEATTAARHHGTRKTGGVTSHADVRRAGRAVPRFEPEPSAKGAARGAARPRPPPKLRGPITGTRRRAVRVQANRLPGGGTKLMYFSAPRHRAPERRRRADSGRPDRGHAVDRYTCVHAVTRYLH